MSYRPNLFRRHASIRRTGILRLAALLLLADLAAALGYLGLVQAWVPPLPDNRIWQAGIVFFADFGSDGQLGPESADRAIHAARLFRDGRVDHLLCVGGRREHPPRFGASIMADALVARGVPRDTVTADRRSFDTRSNWEEASRVVDDRDWRNPLLVSSAVHLFRIGRIVEESFEWTPAPTRSALDELGRRPMGTWLHVHREWLAWAAMWLLPDGTHRELVRRWRNWWD